MTIHGGPPDQLPVYLEAGKKRMFACALEWPGWCRSGRNEEQALATLADYAVRYAPVAAAAGLAFPGAPRPSFQIVERRGGSAAYTDFGVPGVIASSDAAPLSPEEAGRLALLLQASWIVFDRIAAATPPVLRKGPRGGGRDRDQIIDHVLGAEAAYARKLGLRLRPPAWDDAQAVAAFREALVGALRASSMAAPGGWPPRYAVRRITWHVLDHAWEMEDRSTVDQ